MVKKNSTQRAPVLDQESRDNHMIAKVYNLVERQIEDGTASAGVITHFLKLGTAKAQLETKKLEVEARLAEAKIKNINAEESDRELSKNAMDALKQYRSSDE